MLDAIRAPARGLGETPGVSSIPYLHAPHVLPTVIKGGEWMVTYPSSCEATLSVQYMPGQVDGDGGGPGRVRRGRGVREGRGRPRTTGWPSTRRSGSGPATSCRPRCRTIDPIVSRPWPPAPTWVGPAASAGSTRGTTRRCSRGSPGRRRSRSVPVTSPRRTRSTSRAGRRPRRPRRGRGSRAAALVRHGGVMPSVQLVIGAVVRFRAIDATRGREEIARALHHRLSRGRRRPCSRSSSRERSAESRGAAITATGELVAAHGSRRFFADCSALESKASLFDVMAFVEQLLSMGVQCDRTRSGRPAEALRARPDRARVLRDGRRNRGLNIRLFRERDEALAWLAE